MISRAMDQGRTLRLMTAMRRFTGSALTAGLRSMAVTSGKGGVGKTNVVANLAFLLGEMGSRVLVLDADMGLANIDVLLGITPRYTLRDFLEGRCAMEEVLVQGPGGMSILPAGSGVVELTHLQPDQRLSLLNEINALGSRYDLLLIDTAAGVSPNVVHFNALAEEIIVLVTPEPTSLTDAYALIKVMFTRHRRRRFFVLVNEARNEEEGRQVFCGLNGVVERFLHFSLMELGCLPKDPCVPRAVKSQRPFVEEYPHCRATQKLREVANRIRNLPARRGSEGEYAFFSPYA